MYRRILIPTDGSEVAERAARHGVELAEALGSEVYALYVIDISAFTGIPAEAAWESMRFLLEEEGKKALDAVKKLCKERGVEHRLLMKEGRPAEEIVSAAEEVKAELIVMGTSGRTGLDRFLLGSVAEKVVRISSCPVMVVHR